MVNFYIKSITVLGDGKKDSTVEFIDGVNIIKGDSDTGKTKVIESILFAMGASKKPFPEKLGYDTFQLVIDTPGGEIWFERALKSNQIKVVSQNADIEDDVYSATKCETKPFIRDLWLRLIGIESAPMLAYNADSEKWSMTWKAMMPLYCDNEIHMHQLPSYRDVSAREEKSIRQKIEGLKITRKNLQESKKKLEEERAFLMEQNASIERLIKEELDPRKTEIEKLLSEYQKKLDERSEYKVYQQIRKELEEDLKEYITKEVDEEEEQEDYSPKDFFDASFCEKMDEYAKEILTNTGYPNLMDARFDMKGFDIEINGGTKRDDHGKGYCAFINTVMALMMRKYLVKHGTYTPGITIIDSPLHGMFQGVKDDAPESLKTGIFSYFGGLASEGQLIIAENVEHVPEIDYAKMGVKVVEFCKNVPGKRNGFLWDV